MEFHKAITQFKKLLSNAKLVKFFLKDRCCALCDNYNVAIVFQFFLRAKLKSHEYNVKNFFIALVLSHDLYEESDRLRTIILTFYLTMKKTKKSFVTFEWYKMRFFARMQFNGSVRRQDCRKLIEILATSKTRKTWHQGVVNDLILCKHCHCPMRKKKVPLTDEQNAHLKIQWRRESKTYTSFVLKGR